MARKKQRKANGAGRAVTAKASVDARVDFPMSLVDDIADRDDRNHGVRRSPLKLQEYRHPNVWIVRDFFAAKECADWIQYCETPSPKFQFTQQKGTRYMAHRTCYRIQQSDGHAVADRLFRRLPAHVCAVVRRRVAELHGQPRESVGFNPNLRLYKYTPGHSFGKHVDGSHQTACGGTTAVTVLVYLSECEGGATRFYDRRSSFAFQPKLGTMLLHIHGDEHCLEHEAEEVIDGVKYVLRTDMVFR